MNDELQSVIRYMAFANTVTGLLIVAVAIPLILRKVPMNRWYGVRFATSFKNNWLWYELNAYGGKLLVGFGLIWAAYGVAGFWATSSNYVLGMTALILFLCAVLVLLCYRKGKKLEEDYDALQMEEGGGKDFAGD